MNMGEYATRPGRPPWVGEPQDSLVPLVRGGVYRLRSRNLPYGVYDSDEPSGGGFIGIREKFGDRFLFTEFDRHTAQAVEFLGPLPEGVVVSEREPGPQSFCRSCGKAARWTGPPGPAPWECDSGCLTVRPVSAPVNRALFEYLDSLGGGRS